jgi:mannose-6-phosphate isomerase
MPEQQDAAIAAEIAWLGHWLREAAWPTWRDHGVDRARGGFFEALDLRHKNCSAPYRRLRVVARQTYVFSEAHREGLRGAADAVTLGLAFLDRHAPHADGGYAWRFDLDHTPIDLTRDLYDHAFVLLALASATAVVGTAALRDKALALLRWLDAAFPHAQGGYLESLPPCLPRRQNPHMHLLEALLAAYEAFGDAVFLDRAGELAALFATRLFDWQSGALPEYFDDQLRPEREGGIFLVEPGHHCEWVWLLHRLRALGGSHARLDDIATRLMAFVDRGAIDPAHGGIFDLMGSDGAVREHGARLWPQTERLKAEFLRADAQRDKCLQSLAALRAYLRPDGLWHERRSAEGVLLGQPAPASSLYHLTASVLTVERRKHGLF